jgi:hypothetical protein
VNRTFTRIAMATAGIMLAHQVASKAFRDAAFLTAWPATALPLMTVATTAFTIALVPLFSRLLERFPALTVVAAGFALSAVAHAAEWAFYDEGRWITVVIYLHLAGVGAVLLSGFWSLIAERFDPAGARASYGRINAAGTAGGIVGSLAAERIAAMIAPVGVLVLLTILHVLCAIGVAAMGRSPILLSRETEADGGMTGMRETLRTPYVRTIAVFVVLTSAGSAILDFLLKSNATASFGGGPGLLRFFALFYGTVQVLTFFAQTRSGEAVQRLGIGGTVTTLPGGAGVASAVALILQGWPIITAVRAVEAVLRNSLFRSGYELLFVPMDPVMRRRAKTMLDVVCDRTGEAAGAGVVQLFLLASVASLSSSLLAVTVIIAGVSFWFGQRLDVLYLSVVEQQLLKYRDGGAVSLVSEAGWTLLQVGAATPSEHLAAAPSAHVGSVPATAVDPQIETLTDLRSNDVRRVTSALDRRSTFERMHVAQIIQLLAWDEVLPAARTALEQLAPAHLGMLIDAMLDPESDFTIRRRLPRILGTIASPRSLDGLVHGLDDRRFEVRYHCSRAIRRILAKNRELSIDRGRMITIVERELAVPPQVWRGYRLLDRPDVEESAGASEPPEISSRHLEHIFLLLSTIVAREPLDAAVHGIQSSNPGVRGLAIEYLDQVLPAAVLERLRALIASMPSAVDARG